MTTHKKGLKGVTVTSAMLLRLGACSEERRVFRRAFPRGAKFTLDNILKAADADLNIGWLVIQLCSWRTYNTYCARCDGLRTAWLDGKFNYMQYCRKIARVAYPLLRDRAKL